MCVCVCVWKIDRESGGSAQRNQLVLIIWLTRQIRAYIKKWYSLRANKSVYLERSVTPRVKIISDMNVCKKLTYLRIVLLVVGCVGLLEKPVCVISRLCHWVLSVTLLYRVQFATGIVFLRRKRMRSSRCFLLYYTLFQ